MTRLIKGHNLRRKTGIKIFFRESYESKTDFLIFLFSCYDFYFPYLWLAPKKISFLSYILAISIDPLGQKFHTDLKTVSKIP
jgi:hypothetical protein